MAKTRKSLNGNAFVSRVSLLRASMHVVSSHEPYQNIHAFLMQKAWPADVSRCERSTELLLHLRTGAAFHLNCDPRNGVDFSGFVVVDVAGALL